MYLQATAGQTSFSLPLKDISQVLLICELTKIPESPDYFEGFLTIGKTTSPIVNLSSLLGLPHDEIQPFSKFILFKAEDAIGQFGILVSSVDELLTQDFAIETINPDDSINGCISGILTYRDSKSNLLVPKNLLTVVEKKKLHSFSERLDRRNKY